MKNLPPISELKERIRRQSETTVWLRSDVGSYLTAEAVQEGLGAWPKKLAKTDVEFDPDEERTYGQISGGKLSSLAARIVLTAKDEWRLLKALRGVAEAMIAPLVAYLRVNLAMTRLEEVMNKSCHSGSLFADKQHTKREPEGREIVRDLGSAPTSRPFGPLFASKQKTGMTGKKKKTPTFKWHQPPRAAYGFAEAKAAYGFDPRDTSVYWIEKRAARLRRKWAQSRESRSYAPPRDEGSGEFLDGVNLAPPSMPHAEERGTRPSKQGEDMLSSGPKPSFESPGCARPQDEDKGGLPGAAGASCEFPDEPDIPVRHFVPADADYNTIWPPMELPDGPPKPQRAGEVTIDSAHDLQAGEPAVVREVSPLDEALLDGDEVPFSPYPHAEERQRRPSKQGKGIQGQYLQPLFEFRCFGSPQGEDMGAFIFDNTAKDIQPPRNRKERRITARRERLTRRALLKTGRPP